MNDRMSSSWPIRTYFAPDGRDSSEEFRRKVAVVEKNPLLREVLNAMPGMVMVLNANRQIVSANQTVLHTLDVSIEDVLEKRPGEAVGCVNAEDGPDGCGTDRHCITCGAVDAILESQKQHSKIVRECHILITGPSGVNSLDLRVTATPIIVEEEKFVIAAIEDISHTKRLEVLQQVFFHDILNTALCISGFSNSLTKDEKTADAGNLLKYLSEELIEQINAQRDLLAAESDDFAVYVEPVNIPQLLEELRLKYLKNPETDGRSIVLGKVWDGTILTDRRLLRRVLGNMLKNALEAAAAGQTVTVDCVEDKEKIMFTVHNQEVMPKEVQLQIFQRSFSTKAQVGRGIGTYSIKLFAEQYLGGKVYFTSQEPDGTSFVLSIPKNEG